MNSVSEILETIVTNLESDIYVEKEARRSDYGVLRCTDDVGNEYLIKVIQLNAVEEDTDVDVDDTLDLDDLYG